MPFVALISNKDLAEIGFAYTALIKEAVCDPSR
jgi:hypothetical protein